MNDVGGRQRSRYDSVVVTPRRNKMYDKVHITYETRVFRIVSFMGSTLVFDDPLSRKKKGT
jgi:hypothetical protein